MTHFLKLTMKDGGAVLRINVANIGFYRPHASRGSVVYLNNHSPVEVVETPADIDEMIFPVLRKPA